MLVLLTLFVKVCLINSILVQKITLLRFKKILKMNKPNTDIAHVRNDLKEVISYFRKCETITIDIPFISEQVHQINQQGLEFHACLQQSIAQSNKLESHAKSVMSYIEVLKEPIFDTNRILNVL